MEIEGYYDTGCKAEELAWMMSGELDDYHTLGVKKKRKKVHEMKRRCDSTHNQLLHLT